MDEAEQVQPMDAELVRQVLAGRTEAYTDLVQRWAGRVTALCHARVGRPDVAEDLAQEALVRGFEELRSLADPERFGPWLAGIAANTCRDWLKKRQNAQIPFSALPDFDPDGAAAPNGEAPAAVAQADEVRRLLAAVDALPEELRTVLMLYYYEDVTYRDLAHLLDVSVATVNARLTRARALLRDRLGAVASGR
jgi:RNA polymerase sigma-70 factor (ECF subfamily)